MKIECGVLYIFKVWLSNADGSGRVSMLLNIYIEENSTGIADLEEYLEELYEADCVELIRVENIFISKKD